MDITKTRILQRTSPPQRLRGTPWDPRDVGENRRAGREGGKRTRRQTRFISSRPPLLVTKIPRGPSESRGEERQRTHMITNQAFFLLFFSYCIKFHVPNKRSQMISVPAGKKSFIKSLFYDI